nr:PREDICTED: aprataxin and PNK-like factor isoform X5 [Megachile rotundata]
MIVMKSLQLLRVDNDIVQKMDLQVGNNIIGRSVVAGCDDDGTVKHAATINLTPNNEMTITPCQVSPCYMKSVESSRWQLLKLGTTVPIKPGDICSLIPEKCWFKVISVSENMENNQEQTLKRKANDAIDYNMSGKKSCSESGEGDNLGTSHDALNEMLNKNNNNDIIKTKSEDTDSKDYNMSSCKDTTSMTVQNSEELCGMSSSNEGRNHDSNNKIMSEHQSTDLLSTKKEDTCKLQSTNDTDTQLPSTVPDVPAANTVNTPRREKCRYGEKCYRKNAQHKAEFSHPGDADYNIVDDRKECPYGSRCYRKSLQHKMQFKHTDSKVRKESSKRHRKRTPTTVSSDTLSDLEDSSEEESVDESEYEPSSGTEGLDDDDDLYSDNNGSEDDVVK